MATLAPDTSVESSSVDTNADHDHDHDDRHIPGDDGSIAENSMVSDNEHFSTTGGGTTGASGNASSSYGALQTVGASRFCFLLLVLIVGVVAGTVTYLVTSSNQDQESESQVRVNANILFFVIIPMVVLRREKVQFL
jgi:hypothetical protein